MDYIRRALESGHSDYPNPMMSGCTRVYAQPDTRVVAVDLNNGPV